MIRPRQKPEAERLKLALMCGCGKSETVTARADSIIKEQELSGDWISGVSTANLKSTPAKTISL